MKRTFLFAAVLGLAACSSEQPAGYETDTVDKSGGELIVDDATGSGVDVTLPETEMTMVPDDATPAPEASEAPAQ